MPSPEFPRGARGGGMEIFMENFVVSGEYIKLDQLLKATGNSGTGGEAKIKILNGEILVNGEAETRRGRKIKKGDKVSDKNKTFFISVI
jgi:ribosome-associated protein